MRDYCFEIAVLTKCLIPVHPNMKIPVRVYFQETIVCVQARLTNKCKRCWYTPVYGSYTLAYMLRESAVAVQKVGRGKLGLLEKRHVGSIMLVSVQVLT